jgi:23S rRNA pseudouridine1911/1915/1917 synthase
MFQNKEIRKTYFAVVDQRPEPLSGTLKHYLVKNPENNTVRAYTSEKKDSKLASLDYEYIGQFDKSHHLLKVNLHTGRPHQIRVQLAKIGCIIIGDMKYGAQYPNMDKSICLHCRTISFTHPVTKAPVSITADLPANHLWKEISELASQEGI